MVAKAALLSALLALASGFVPESVQETDKLADIALNNQASYAATDGKTMSCQDPVVRKEWSDLSVDDRKEWIAAVSCLMDKPARSGSLAPGARSRYDDFLATHINQTMRVHFTGNFLFWHRYFVLTFERALRQECNYSGHQPYANWGKYAQNPIDSPVFDGSDASIGSNGKFSPRLTVLSIPPWAKPDEPHLELPLNALGGGCIDHGPFSNRTVNMGPVDFRLTDPLPNPRKDGLGYNPRCMRREISSYVSQRMVTDALLKQLLVESPNITYFQDTMEGAMGVHTGGHSLVGSDPGQNLYESPADPHFWLHHAYIDRAWWIWQNQQSRERRLAVSGTLTFQNNPPSANATLDDPMDLGVNGGTVKLSSMISTLEGDLCYVYG